MLLKYLKKKKVLFFPWKKKGNNGLHNFSFSKIM